MVSTYTKLQMNQCGTLQGLTYRTITDSERQVIIDILIEYVVPLMNYDIEIDFITKYILAVLICTKYNINIDIEESINIDISQ